MQRKTMVDYVKEVPQLLAKNVESASELVNPLINYVEGKEIKDILLFGTLLMLCALIGLVGAFFGILG